MGATESNAGDDFHFWWTAGRALELVSPGAELELVTVEGLAVVDDPDEQYETVDAAEYFGGRDVASADRIVLSQLKYSTRHAETAWTAAPGLLRGGAPTLWLDLADVLAEREPIRTRQPTCASRLPRPVRDDGYDAADRLELLAGAPASRAPSTPSSAETCSIKPSTRPSASTTSRSGPLQDGVGGGKKTA
ncbi:hypothetical protein [Streptomyces sp. NPDC052042]|uniref:hypothetical protein n=1 Tax=Streptomyces sp. NPDC052042 TaxID=3365683 RepID=UPI0037CE01F1